MRSDAEARKPFMYASSEHLLQVRAAVMFVFARFAQLSLPQPRSFP